MINSGVNFSSEGVVVSEVEADSPASQNGIEKNSQITLINGEPINNSAEFFGTVNKFLGKPILLTVCKSNICNEIKITPRENPPRDQGPLGIVISDVSSYNKSTARIIYDEMYKRFAGKDLYTTIFGKRVLVLSWIMLASGVISTIISVKLIKTLPDRFHGKVKYS